MLYNMGGGASKHRKSSFHICEHKIRKIFFVPLMKSFSDNRSQSANEAPGIRGKRKKSLWK